jgi:UDPglucose--hexose-1-phosphate uridylyltransferase
MSEIRQDAVVGRWVIVATERTRRPNEFAGAGTPPPEPAVDPFAEGNEHLTPPEIRAVRPTGSPPNSPGWRVRVVPNRFPVLRIEGSLDKEGEGIYDRMSGIGAHEVIIETPKTGQEIEEQPLEHIAEVVGIWRARITDLLRDERFRYILVFKNHGAQAGATLSHSHSQIIALPVTPKTVKEKLVGAQAYFEHKERNIFADILRQELKDGRRIVYQNGAFVCYCPYASRFPFELCIMPRRQCADFHRILDTELLPLADVLKSSLLRLRSGLNRPQYNVVLHTAPARYPKRGYWSTVDQDFRWHLEITPRLTQIAGFEMGTGFYVNPVMPEEAAQFLKDVEV